MYKGGPKFRPPILNFKIHGMPESDDEADDDFGMLKDFHRNKDRRGSFAPIGLGMKRYLDIRLSDYQLIITCYYCKRLSVLLVNLVRIRRIVKSISGQNVTKSPRTNQSKIFTFDRILIPSFRENTPKESNGRDMPRAQREEFEQGLRTLVPIRELIGDMMALCLEQSDHAGEIVSGKN